MLLYKTPLFSSLFPPPKKKKKNQQKNNNKKKNFIFHINELTEVHPSHKMMYLFLKVKIAS